MDRVTSGCPKIDAYIKDVCDKAHVCDSAMKRSLLQYELFVNKLSKCQGKKKFVLAVHAMYTTLTKLNTPFSVNELCYFSGV